MPQHPFTIQSFKELLPRVGEKIREARQAKGMTQGDLAQLIGLSSKSVSAMEVGRVEPSITQMQSIAAVLEEPIGYFTGETSSSVDVKLTRVANELEDIRQLMELIQAKKKVKQGEKA